MANVNREIHSRAMTSESMVEKYVKARGIENSLLLEAMQKIPRHLFVSSVFREQAYSDRPLPIGHEQTISQPFIVALMTQHLLLTGKERVLEIGTGSGYQTALLAELAKSVFSIERIRSLAIQARKRLEELNYENISISTGNGAWGWKEYAPFDRIIVTACMKEIPQELTDQLMEEGRMVVPLGKSSEKQDLYLFIKNKSSLERKFLSSCSFVPFIS